MEKYLFLIISHWVKARYSGCPEEYHSHNGCCGYWSRVENLPLLDRRVFQLSGGVDGKIDLDHGVDPKQFSDGAEYFLVCADFIPFKSFR